MKKKYQIFISSTYTDLIEERQAAVEAILSSRHIPAGMELFKAGNKSQLETIKKWIDESDLYMLILGGRYGSIEEEGGKSYTQIEYEYAIEKGIPIFAVVLKDSFLHKKAADHSYEVFEKDNKEKYEEFKKLVMSRMIVEVEDCKDIKLAIKDSITELEEENELVGWVKATKVDNENKLLMENEKLSQENERLKVKLLSDKIEKDRKINVIDMKDICKDEDEIKISYRYDNEYRDYYEGKLRFVGSIEVTWNKLFKHIGPQFSTRKCLDDAKEIIDYEILDIVQDRNRKEKVCELEIFDEDFVTIRYQYDALNLIELEEYEGEETMILTELGKRKLASLVIQKKSDNE